MPDDEERYELDQVRHSTPGMEEEETAGGRPSADRLSDGDRLDEEDYLVAEDRAIGEHDEQLDRRTKRKLDFILLPFLAALFLLNSMDKSNIGNAETAGFTKDCGLEPEDLNMSMGFFFAFFVALQPVGAALGRKFGMKRWVPGCMSLWGLCTLLHMWVRARWQLILLRIAIATLEAGFYPTTVSYLSLFYTRYEFAVRLGFFYGQTAVAGVLGGILSWAVFSRFPGGDEGPQLPPIPPPTTAEETNGWKSWEALFLIEGCLTIVVALVGFFWLPHSADTAWFFNAQEKKWAERRIILDRDEAMGIQARRHVIPEQAPKTPTDDETINEDADVRSHHRLLQDEEQAAISRSDSNKSFPLSITADAGLTKQEILSAFLNYKIWHLLICNILSAIPATAFSVFLPLVVEQLSPSLNLSPAASNLLAAPPFAFGAVVLFIFTKWSDYSKRRLVPILSGLVILLIGLTATVLVPMKDYILRYIFLCVLLSGSFIASPLTVAWISNNTPELGKRAIMLGINGWGNFAGVFLSVLFTPADSKTGYFRPFMITLSCVIASLAGFVGFFVILVQENKQRKEVLARWSEDEREQEDLVGDLPVPHTVFHSLQKRLKLDVLARRLGMDENRRGDRKMTYMYTY